MKLSIKKTLFVLMAFVLIVSLFAFTTANAAQKGVITVSSSKALIGETVDVDITVEYNPGIMGMTLDVIFDQNALELVNVTDSGILGIQSHKKEKVSPYRLAWSDDTATINNTATGTAATLSFKITDGAVQGSAYSIEITYDYDNYDIYDTDMNPVEFDIVSGSIEIPAPEHTHTLTKIAAKASTCLTQGNNEYYYCADCGKYFKDSNGENETTLEAEKLPLAAHNYVENASAEYLKSEATCTEQAVYYKSCSVCGEKSDETFTYGSTLNHDYSDEWKFDINGHWHECVVCGEKADEAAHVSSGAATEEKAEVCTVCGYVITPALEHTHKLTLVEGIKATCQSEGKKAYYVCEGCGKWFEDGTASVEIIDKNSIVLPQTAHTPSDWIVNKAATETETGSRHKECTVCGEILETEIIPVIEPATTVPATTIAPTTAEPTTTAPMATSAPTTAAPTTTVPSTTVAPDTTVPTTTVEPTTTEETTSEVETTTDQETLANVETTVQGNTKPVSTVSEPNDNNPTAVQTGETSLAVLVLIVLMLGVAIAYATYSRKRDKR